MQKYFVMRSELKAFEHLLDIMDRLRAECPWDSSQTIESLRYLTIEETYELSDAILEKDMPEISKELGDLLLHIVFYAKIGSETGDFTMTEVINGICEKLIKRHPHIFSDTIVSGAEDVKNNWERIKLEDKDRTVLSGVPLSLPAVVKAYRIQEKVRGVGFDWEKPEQVWEKVMEELTELRKEVEDNAPVERREDEFGDLMFALVNYSRFIGVNPEDALERTNKKFIRRFNHLEKRAKETGKALHQMSLSEMDVFWDEAKKME